MPKLKESDLFLPSGYLNMAVIIDTGKPFIFITGGRGTGKTFGALDLVTERGLRFAFLRRTETQSEIAGNEMFSPFRAINRVRGTNFQPFPIIKKLRAIHPAVEDEDGRIRKAGPMLGFIGALSTFSNVRGFDASDVDIMILDEFCPEEHERPIKDEGTVFENVYESIDRNRQLEGRKPLQCVCLANSNDLASPILETRGLVRVMEHLGRTGQQIWENETTLCIRISKSPISKRKGDTALYKSTANDRFREMALNNQYAVTYDEKRRPRYNLTEYKPVLYAGELAVYRHKSRPEWLCTLIRKGAPVDSYTDRAGDREQMLYKYRHIRNAYLQGHVYFSEAAAQIQFLRAFGMKK